MSGPDARRIHRKVSWSLHLKANAGDEDHVGGDVSAATDAGTCGTKDARVLQSMPLVGKGAHSSKGMPFPRFCVNEPESEAFENRNYGERDVFRLALSVFPHLLRMDSTEGHWHRLSWTYFVYLRELHCLKSTPIGHSILSNCSRPVRDWLGAEHPLPGGNFRPMGSGGQI